ncbi:MAG: UMP kinase [Aigarchaeota archaeon]|nr:UMP kinase [Aigarchaeota archaeon]MCX8192394.1 UMP kinase [Nitrososphaeria archaeon]MDW7986488.1 UMP kinase [Nitrososphaerota archaeon]
MNIVVKIGGHLIFNEEIDIELLTEYSRIFREMYDGGRWVVVVGGGKLARRYVEAARRLGLSESLCDEIGIKITRVNASILSSSIGDKAHPLIPENLDQLRAYSTQGRIVVMGGLQPGQSTIAVSALAAEAINAEKLIVATDVDGIYTADPKKDPRARLLKEVSVKELMEKLIEYSHEAGEYKLADFTGLKIIARSRITTIYLNGRNPENLKKALRGEQVGTLLKP